MIYSRFGGLLPRIRKEKSSANREGREFRTLPASSFVNGRWKFECRSDVLLCFPWIFRRGAFYRESCWMTIKTFAKNLLQEL